MKLLNKGEQFEITYDGADFTVPAGEMEINNDGLALHIIECASKWGFQVSKTAATKIEIKKTIEPMIKQADDLVATEKATKAEEPKEEVKVNKNLKSIKDLEATL